VAASLPPLYLLADSQLLFWKPGGEYWLASIGGAAGAAGAPRRAAYIGASNGDRPEFYGLFESAMDQIGVMDRRMIRSAFPSADERFLATADIILLAGGDAGIGWTVLADTGMKDLIARRFAEGAALIGVSAGAMHLGKYGMSERGMSERDSSAPALFQTLGFCPFIVATHDEARNWQSLTRAVEVSKGAASGLAIRSGAGVVYHADGTIAPVRYPAHELRWVDAAVEWRCVPVGQDRV
jgi:cyanophycinase